MERWAIDCFASEAPGAPLVVLNAVQDEARAVWDAVRELTSRDFSLAVIGDLDWNGDLTPWPGEPAGPWDEPYAGRADAYLDALTGRLLPDVFARLPAPPEYVALAGYSLAGLFALYAPFRADAFARVASVSGSLWYPGFLEFARAHAPVRRPDRVYLSVGDREARTKSEMMRPVEDNTRALAEDLRRAGIPTRFELNPGGHFKQPVRRTAKGIAWLLEP